ncbi:MAG: hypothetical protein HOQ12_15395 [Gemmatimonadaceae bacterium]|nr:hypothetical protein [Gemmatimonadaceae bacterium]
MSYAPNPTRLRSATRESAGARNAGRDRLTSTESRPRRGNGGSTPPKPPRGRSYEEAGDWGQIALVAGGIAAGAAIGAGVALLFTAETGPERRAGIARRARRFGHDAEQKWEDLAFELKEAARAARDKLRLRRARKHTAAGDDETDADD